MYRANLDKPLHDLFVNLAKNQMRIVVDHDVFEKIERTVTVHLT
jgi:hypothetical protein